MKLLTETETGRVAGGTPPIYMNYVNDGSPNPDQGPNINESFAAGSYSPFDAPTPPPPPLPGCP